MTTLLRSAVRSLLHSPGFTAATVLTLALGLGAATAIFSVLYAVLLRPFAYPEADRLVVMWQKGPQMEMSIAWPTAQDWMKDNQAFAALAIHRRDRFNLSAPGRLAENVNGAYAAASLFDVAGIAPLRGRYYTADEDKAGAEPVVVISEQLWERRFGRDPALLGRTIPVDGVARTVIGIAPASLGLPRLAEVWLPIAPYAATQPSWQSRGNNPGLYSLARMKPGVTVDQAYADLERIYAGLRKDFSHLQDVTARVQPYRENQTDAFRTGLWALLGATLFVLAIACGSLMPDEKKQRIYELIAAHDLPIIEDDIYGDTHFGDVRPKPLKAWDRDGRVMLCSSFGKTLAPGFHVGWSAPGRYLERIRRLKFINTMGTPRILQKTLAEFLRDGGYDHHLRSLRRAYSQHLHLFLQGMQRYFPEGTRFSRPQGGNYIWVEFPAKVDSLRLRKEALKHKINLAPGSLFTVKDRYRHCIRMSCSQPWSDEMDTALRTVGELVRQQL
jgi:hypothetical protein